MGVGPVDAPLPTLLAAGFAVVVVVVLLVAASTSGAAFGTHNPGWEGLSEVRSTAEDAGVETAVATDATDYAAVEHEGTVVLLVAPEETTVAERARLRTLVENGGTVVVAARDPAVANPLFSTLGADVRVDGELLRDERAYDPTPNFPLVTDVADHPYVGDARGMTLNHGSALATADALAERAEADGAGASWSEDARATADASVWRAPDGPRPLANSSAYGYVDRDGSDELDADEYLGARPVVAVESVGDGEVVAVADPSAVINVMVERAPNRAFVAGLVGEHERLVVDRTDGGVPPLVGALGAIRTTPALGALVALVLVGGVLAWERRPLGGVRAWWRRRRSDVDVAAEVARPDPVAVGAYLRDRYPELDERQRERVLGGIMSVERERGHHDRGD